MVFGSGNSVYFARSRNGGKAFSEPIKVGEVAALPLGMHRGPRVGFAGKTIIVSAISSTKRGEDGDLVSWRSTDGGDTWSSAKTITDVPAAAREGLHGMAASADGTVFLTWLDLRNKAMQLYGAVSRDGGLTWGPDIQVYVSPDGAICTCCHPTPAVSDKGELYVMWRNAKAGSRDMYLASSSDSGRTWREKKLGEGTWPLNACPMDGGGMAFGPGQALHTVWRRQDTIYRADAGNKETPLGKGKNPAIAVNESGSYIAWSDGPELKLLRPGKTEPEVLSQTGAFPVLAGDDRVYATWEEQGSIGFARLDQ